MSETIDLSIGWRFDESDSGTMDARLKNATDVLEKHGCLVNTIKTENLVNGGLEIEFLAVCPIRVRAIHYGFDSMLNKPFARGGAEAGWVCEL